MFDCETCLNKSICRVYQDNYSEIEKLKSDLKVRNKNIVADFPNLELCLDCNNYILDYGSLSGKSPYNNARGCV